MAIKSRWEEKPMQDKLNTNPGAIQETSVSPEKGVSARAWTCDVYGNEQSASGTVGALHGQKVDSKGHDGTPDNPAGFGNELGHHDWPSGM